MADRSNLETKLDESGVHRVAKKSVTLTRILESIIDTGHDILNRSRNDSTHQPAQPEELGRRCQELIRHLGEASGLALASEILDDYAALTSTGRLELFEILIRDFGVDPANVIAASDRYRQQPDFDNLTAITRAIEAPRQKLFRRLNMVPGGTSALVAMRGHLLKVIKERPEFKPLDIDLRQLLIEWFNRGFLVLESVSWSSSARVLEKIIAYEAVHEIGGWDDLRGRLTDDRRCFAFFHPAMPDDPIIFVEIALTEQSITTIDSLLRVDHEIQDPRKADTATFYSISNCHLGLHGISFGNFLIKQVMEELRRDLPYVSNFETLSPVPGFRRWVEAIAADPEKSAPHQDDLKMIESRLAETHRPDPSLVSDSEKAAFLRLCAHFLLNEKGDRWPLDPVARFHLSNGASLDRIIWSADCSAAGENRSFGIMVNYVYRAADIERNHEAYFAEDQVAASAAVCKLTHR